jgi:FG-GAP-like repeat
MVLLLGTERRRAGLVAALATALLLATAAVAQGSCTIGGPATDQAEAAGIAQTTQSIGTTVGDLNGDGLPDFLLNRAFSDTAREYLNQGGSFAEANAGTFVQNDKHGCAIADVNGDGLPDIYCTVGASHGVDVKANELWVQQPDGSFQDEAAAYGVDDPVGRSRGAIFFDANNDGWPDLFVANYYPRPDGLPTPNRFYLNQGGEGFRSAPEFGLNQQVGGLALSPGCQVAGDYDGDGYQDLLVCGKVGVHLYHNDAGAGFTDVTDLMGLNGTWVGAAMVDFNGDGKLDLLLIKHDQFELRLQGENGRFREVSLRHALDGGRALATGDVNGDGLPDLYVVQGAQGGGGEPNPPDIMYLNVAGTDVAPVPIPETDQGNGASVSAIDYNGDGTTDFLVTNGARKLDGPVQLISFPPPG